MSFLANRKKALDMLKEKKLKCAITESAANVQKLHVIESTDGHVYSFILIKW